VSGEEKINQDKALIWAL